MLLLSLCGIMLLSQWITWKYTVIDRRIYLKLNPHEFESMVVQRHLEILSESQACKMTS